MAIDLHGAEVVEAPAPEAVVAPVGDVPVIGLVGAAPNAQGALSAAALLGVGDAALVITAAASGAAGNDVTVRFVNPGAANQALAVAVDGTAITASLATDATGVVTTTATQLKTGWDAAAAVVAVATCAKAAGASGADKVAPLAATPLAGGEDEPFPADVPVLVTKADLAAKLGAGSSLLEAMRDVWRTCKATEAPAIVAVKAATDDDAGFTGARVGRTGAYALLDAESTTGRRPLLLAAPGRRSAALAVALESVAGELRGWAVTSLAGANLAAALAAKQTSGLSATLVCWPDARVPAVGGGFEVRPMDALMCGHIARVTADENASASPSNRAMRGVSGPSVGVGWAADDRAADANLLSRAHVCTIAVVRGEARAWGNRLANGAFFAKERVRGLVRGDLLGYLVEAVDRVVDTPFVRRITKGMNAVLRERIIDGVLREGEAWYDPAKNPPEALAQDRLTVTYRIGVPGYSEQITADETVSTYVPEVG